MAGENAQLITPQPLTVELSLVFGQVTAGSDPIMPALYVGSLFHTQPAEGRFIKAEGVVQGAEQIWVIHADTGSLFKTSPDGTGAWSLSVHPGDYYVVAIAPSAGCAPLTHGPITVT
jgi:hypothetical protein